MRRAVLRALRGGDHLHAGRGLADAGRREHALALDLDHAGAAVAVGPVAGLGQPAEMRDLDALAPGHLPDGLAGRGLDLAAVEGERDRIGHDGNLNRICHCRANMPRTTAIRNPVIHLSSAQVAFDAAKALAHLAEEPARFSAEFRQFALVVGDLLGRGARLVVGHVAGPQSVVELTQHQRHGLRPASGRLAPPHMKASVL